MDTSKMTLIGTVTLKKAETFEEHFECAAWYRKIKVQPGKYDLYYYRPYGSSSTYVMAELPGIIESDYFESLWCGVRIPGGKPYDTLQNAGKEAVYTLDWLDYMAIARSKGEKLYSISYDYDFEFNPDLVTIDERKYKNSSGEEEVMYKLIPKKKAA